jgi:hypothetical protein
MRFELSSCTRAPDGIRGRLSLALQNRQGKRKPPARRGPDPIKRLWRGPRSGRPTNASGAPKPWPCRAGRTEPSRTRDRAAPSGQRPPEPAARAARTERAPRCPAAEPIAARRQPTTEPSPNRRPSHAEPAGPRGAAPAVAKGDRLPARVTRPLRAPSRECSCPRTPAVHPSPQSASRQ